MSDLLIRRLIRLAAQPTAYPNCPFDGAELDLHLHGGASCPSCGHDFEIGQQERVLPSDRSIEEHAAGWPNTIPLHMASDWRLGSLTPEEDDWAPSVPELKEMTSPEPERYFKWLYHPTLGSKIWEIDGPDGHPWHARMQNDWIGYGNPIGDEMIRGYGVVNHNGGVVHNYGSGYKSDLLPEIAEHFKVHYPEIEWRPYVPTEP